MAGPLALAPVIATKLRSICWSRCPAATTSTVSWATLEVSGSTSVAARPGSSATAWRAVRLVSRCHTVLHIHAARSARRCPSPAVGRAPRARTPRPDQPRRPGGRDDQEPGPGRGATSLACPTSREVLPPQRHDCRPPPSRCAQTRGGADRSPCNPPPQCCRTADGWSDRAPTRSTCCSRAPRWWCMHRAEF
jgi:hypothetical protein